LRCAATASAGIRNQLEAFSPSIQRGRIAGTIRFARVERKYMGDKNILLKRNISRFAYFQRKQEEIRPNRVTWHFRPPRDSFF
jgi:hypothetical protein